MLFSSLQAAQPVRSFAKKAAAPPASKMFDLARPFEGHRLPEVPTSKVESNREQLLKFYRTMVEFRRFEIVCDNLYKARHIRGFCHLYDGQEAIVAGMADALHPKDSWITGYREHCHQVRSPLCFFLCLEPPLRTRRTFCLFLFFTGV